MKLKYQFAIQKVFDFYAAVPVGADTNNYHGVISVNETASDIMKFLQEDLSEDQLVQKMLEIYDVAETDLRPQVVEFVQKLREAGVLVE